MKKEAKTTVILENTLHNTRTSVRASRIDQYTFEVSPSVARRVKRDLCGMDCQCASGDLDETVAYIKGEDDETWAVSVKWLGGNYPATIEYY